MQADSGYCHCKWPFLRGSLDNGLFRVRWREGGRGRSMRVRGSAELAKQIERKKLSLRDENRHLDVKKEINYRIDDLIDRYWTHYGSKKKSADREKSIVEGIIVSAT